MILADKIIRLRKKNGWSQEELAEKMNVSRQAVSKWEGAQSIPDLEKILKLGELFGVTTDYLLKDDREEEEFSEDSPDTPLRLVSLADACAFLEWRKAASVRIACAADLCIVAVIPLLLLGAASETPSLGISEALAGIGGLILLLLMVAAAVAIFLSTGFRNAPYEFLDKEPFETEYGVAGMVRERQNAYRNTYAKCNILGTCLCILAPVPLFLGSFWEQDLLMIGMLSVTLLITAAAVFFFTTAGVRWASMQKLLKEGEFSAAEKKQSRTRSALSTAYWLIATAVYLGWSFLTNDWKLTWIVWPVAGVLFAAFMTICNLFFHDGTD